MKERATLDDQPARENAILYGVGLYGLACKLNLKERQIKANYVLPVTTHFKHVDNLSLYLYGMSTWMWYKGKGNI